MIVSWDFWLEAIFPLIVLIVFLDYGFIGITRILLGHKLIKNLEDKVIFRVRRGVLKIYSESNGKKIRKDIDPLILGHFGIAITSKYVLFGVTSLTYLMLIERNKIIDVLYEKKFLVDHSISIIISENNNKLKYVYSDWAGKKIGSDYSKIASILKESKLETSKENSSLKSSSS